MKSIKIDVCDNGLKHRQTKNERNLRGRSNNTRHWRGGAGGGGEEKIVLNDTLFIIYFTLQSLKVLKIFI